MTIISVYDAGGPPPQALILNAFHTYLSGKEARRPDLSAQLACAAESPADRKASA